MDDTKTKQIKDWFQQLALTEVNFRLSDILLSWLVKSLSFKKKIKKCPRYDVKLNVIARPQS